MAKKLKAIIITCCIGVIALAAFFVIDAIIMNQSPGTTETITITSVSKSDVASVKVTLADGEYYYVTEDAAVSASAGTVSYKTTFNGIYEGVQYDATKAKNLVSLITSLTASRDLGEATEAEYAAYGLDEPLSTVVLTKTNNSTLTFYVGSRTTSGLYYFRAEGNDHVYAIQAGAGEIFTRRSNDMRLATVPLSNDLSKVKSLTVKSGDDAPITVVIDDSTSVYNPFSTYYTTSPWTQKRPASPDSVAGLVEAMNTIAINSFVTPLADGSKPDLAEYGLDKPWGYVREELKDGTVYEYSFGDYTKDVLDYYCYAYDHQSEQIFVITHDKATFVSKYTAIQMTTPYVINAMMSDMKNVEIEFGSEKHVLECIRTYLSEEEKKALEEAGKTPVNYTSVYRMDGIKYSESALSALYICLTGARVQATNKGYAHEAEPMLTLRFVPFDGAEPVREIKFHKYNDNFCVVYVDGIADFLTSYGSVKAVIDGVGIVQKGEVPPYVI